MGASGAPAGIFARSALADQSVTAFPLASTRAMKLAGPSGRVVPPKAQICPSASSLAPCSPSQPTGMSFMVPASRSMTCSLASRSSRLLATQRRSLLSRRNYWARRGVFSIVGQVLEFVRESSALARPIGHPARVAEGDQQAAFRRPIHSGCPVTSPT